MSKKILASFLLLLPSLPILADSSASVVSVKLDRANYSSEMVTRFDLRNTFLNIDLAQAHSQTRLDQLLALLVKQSNQYPMISGLSIDTKLPLDQSAAQSLSLLAKKAALFNFNFQFQSTKDWLEVFKAEALSNRLISVIYGSSAMTQLQQMPSSAVALASTNVPLIYIFTPDFVSRENTQKFWNNFSSTLRDNAQSMAVALVDSKINTNVDYAKVGSVSVRNSGGYLSWIGGYNDNQLVPIVDHPDVFTVWRKNTTGLRGSSFNRKTAPFGLYASLGPSDQAFSLLTHLVKRVQLAEKNQVSLLSDTEQDLPVDLLLSQVSDAIILSDIQETLPPNLSSNQSTSVWLVQDPDAQVADKLLENPTITNQLAKANTVALFDYSLVRTKNKSFYLALQKKLANNPGFQFMYNTGQSAQLQLAVTALQPLKPKEIFFGPDAVLLISEQVESFWNDHLKLIDQAQDFLFKKIHQ